MRNAFTSNSRRIARVHGVQSFPGNGQVFRKHLVLMPGQWDQSDPFLMMAEDWWGKPGGFEPHPHRGIETVTYVISGAIEHRDNRGHVGVLRPGDVQWMTAGSGIIHSEMPYGLETVHSLQLWVNLPKERKMIEPRYQDLPAAQVPVRREPGVEARVYSGKSGDIAANTLNHWPVTMVDLRLDAKARFVQEVAPADNGFFYVLQGAGKFGADGQAGQAGDVLWLAPASAGEDAIVVEATAPLHALYWAGPPIRQPVAAGGPFVMNTEAEVYQAFDDYRAGKFGPFEVA